MLAVRASIFGLVVIVAGGAIAASAGYAWYLRSATCRERARSALSETLGLPADIGRVVPRSLTARQFNDVVVWLPDRRGQALVCREAVVVERPTVRDPTAYDLVLRGGSCEISPRTWLRDDYRSVLESGLRPGFAPDGPQRVDFSEMDISFQRERFGLTLDDAAGRVSFEDARLGVVHISCSRLNGHAADYPVFLDGAFAPANPGIRVETVELTVPRLPLRILRLGELSGAAIDSGTFDGRVTYSEAGGQKLLVLSGHCADLELCELTAMLPRPWRGRCPDVELTELRVADRRPTAMRFRGVLTGVQLADVLAPWGFGHIDGAVELSVRTAELTERGIERLIASGRCTGVALEPLTAAIGAGRMSGDLRVLIDDLTIIDNHVATLRATLQVQDATEHPNWVEGALLRAAVHHVLKFNLPPLLPERIEYTRLGLRIDIRDEVLNVFGTHGSDGRAILTIRLLGQDLELVKEPRQSFDLRPTLADARRRLAELLRGPLEELDRRTQRAPPGAPREPGPRRE